MLPALTADGPVRWSNSNQTKKKPQMNTDSHRFPLATSVYLRTAAVRFLGRRPT